MTKNPPETSQFSQSDLEALKKDYEKVIELAGAVFCGDGIRWKFKGHVKKVLSEESKTAE